MTRRRRGPVVGGSLTRLRLRRGQGSRVRLWSAVVAMVAAIVCVPASPAAALPSDFTPYHIINGATPDSAKMCLAVRDDPPQIGTPIVQKACNKTDRLEGWYDGTVNQVPDLQRTTTGMWITQGTWCIGGDVSNRGHAVVIKGTYLDSSNCLSFNVLGNAATGFDLQETSSGLCLAISGGALTSGAGLIFWTCEGTRSWKYPSPGDSHGGREINHKGFGGVTSKCTVGFNVYDQYFNPYFLTAGHCALNQDATWWSLYTLPYMQLNTGVTEAFADQSYTNTGPGGDWALVAYANNGYTTYGTANFNNSAGWTDITGSDNPTYCVPPSCNQTVYFYGATSHFHSGHIVSIDDQESFAPVGSPAGTQCPVPGCVTIRHLIATDFCTQGGDSGGPLIANDPINGGPHIALGTLIGSDGDGPNGSCLQHSYFMPINETFRQIAAQTGLQVNVY
jgi:hypothetical protein